MALAFVYRVFQKADMQKGKEFVSLKVLTWLILLCPKPIQPDNPDLSAPNESQLPIVIN